MWVWTYCQCTGNIDVFIQHAREFKFGGNLNRFEDIGVDLNKGVSQPGSDYMCYGAFLQVCITVLPFYLQGG